MDGHVPLTSTSNQSSTTNPLVVTFTPLLAAIRHLPHPLPLPLRPSPSPTSLLPLSQYPPLHPIPRSESFPHRFTFSVTPSVTHPLRHPDRPTNKPRRVLSNTPVITKTRRALAARLCLRAVIPSSTCSLISSNSSPPPRRLLRMAAPSSHGAVHSPASTSGLSRTRSR